MHSTANGGGYVKFPRALKYSWVYQDAVTWLVLSHLLLSANYKPADIRLDDGRMIHLEPGQLLVSRASLARATGISESKIERTINRFKNERIIEQISFSKFRIISICNWHEYQGSEQITEQKTNQKPDTEKNIRIKEKEYIGGSADVFQQITDVLNSATGKNFKSTGQILKRLVTARTNEGFTADDLVSVIHAKATQWRDDPKMSRYLRPETLFGSKFESYLNEAGGQVETGRVSSWQDQAEAAAMMDILED